MEAGILPYGVAAATGHDGRQLAFTGPGICFSEFVTIVDFDQKIGDATETHGGIIGQTHILYDIHTSSIPYPLAAVRLRHLDTRGKIEQ